MAVPPPNQHWRLASACGSSACSTKATLRWCSRSNKQPPSPQRLGQRLDEGQLRAREARAIDVSPVALVQVQRLFRAHLLHVGQLPGELAQLRVVVQADALRERRRRLCFAAVIQKGERDA